MRGSGDEASLLDLALREPRGRRVRRAGRRKLRESGEVAGEFTLELIGETLLSLIGLAADVTMKWAWHHHRGITLGIAIPLACFLAYGVFLCFSRKTAQSPWRQAIRQATIIVLSAGAIIFFLIS
jgi:hypothetical protein